MNRLTVYFDYGSPYAYLAWQRISNLVPERYEQTEVAWVPASAGHIFKADGSAPNATMPNQGAYLYQDVARWADAYGVPFSPPARNSRAAMPVNSIQAMRLHFLAANRGQVAEAAWMDAVFYAYFRDGVDISDRAVLARLAASHGLPSEPEAWGAPDLKKRLIACTNAALEAGAPGVPYMVLEVPGGTRATYWGNDRLAWVEAAVGGAPPPAL